MVTKATVEVILTNPLLDNILSIMNLFTNRPRHFEQGDVFWALQRYQAHTLLQSESFKNDPIAVIVSLHQHQPQIQFAPSEQIRIAMEHEVATKGHIGNFIVFALQQLKCEVDQRLLTLVEQENLLNQ